MAEENHTVALSYDASDEYRPEPPPAPEIPPWKDGSIRIGIHTSIAGDVTRALDIAAGLGANALQIFSSSPRMWDRGTSRIADADAERFRARRKELALGPLVIHSNYLINLASPNPVLRARSVQAFHQEIVRALSLGADYLVLHPGSAVSDNRGSAVSTIAQSLKQAARTKAWRAANPARKHSRAGKLGWFEVRGAARDSRSVHRFAARRLHRHGSYLRGRMGHSHGRGVGARPD